MRRKKIKFKDIKDLEEKFNSGKVLMFIEHDKGVDVTGALSPYILMAVSKLSTRYQDRIQSIAPEPKEDKPSYVI